MAWNLPIIFCHANEKSIETFWPQCLLHIRMCKLWLLVTTHYFQDFRYVMKLELKLGILSDKSCCTSKISSNWSRGFLGNLFWSANCIMSFCQIEYIQASTSYGLRRLTFKVESLHTSIFRKGYATTFMTSFTTASIY